MCNPIWKYATDTSECPSCLQLNHSEQKEISLMRYVWIQVTFGLLVDVLLYKKKHKNFDPITHKTAHFDGTNFPQ